jgi:hypothetical protein
MEELIMGMKERIERKRDRVQATEKYIIGLLFEIESPQEEKEKVAKEISEDIFGQCVWSKPNFQKIALGHLTFFAGKIPNEQLVAISKKIAFFV